MDRNEYIRTLVSEAAELLKEMVRIPSPSFSETAVCDHVSGWMKERGIEHERIGNNIVAEHITDPSGTTLMLCAHMDTVSPAEGYDFDPYDPHYDVAADVISGMTGMEVGPDDIVAGLGSNDDGASLVAMLAAYRFICNNDNSSRDSGFGNRAIPLVAGGGTRSEGVGGVVLGTAATAPCIVEITIYGKHGDDRCAVIIAAKARHYVLRPDLLA